MTKLGRTGDSKTIASQMSHCATEINVKQTVSE